MNGMLGRKLEMTQMFDEHGRLLPVTLIQAGPCVVTQVKTADTDGYAAVQLALVERCSRKKVSKAIRGVCEKADVAPVRAFAEFRLTAGEEPPDRGGRISCDIFQAGDHVDVSGKSKGRGFQGVVKRHGFGGGRASRGSMFHRAPGSIGQSAFPSRVFRGTRMGGQMGHANITAKNLRVLHVDAENNLIAVCGAVPGARNTLVKIRMGQKSPKREG